MNKEGRESMRKVKKHVRTYYKNWGWSLQLVHEFIRELKYQLHEDLPTNMHQIHDYVNEMDHNKYRGFRIVNLITWHLAESRTGIHWVRVYDGDIKDIT